MTYYYLIPNKDIIQEGDEYIFNYQTNWKPCKASIGRTIQEHSGSMRSSTVWKVRRPVSKLGNRL